MKKEFKDRFTALWEKYFPEVELPIGFYFANEATDIETPQNSGEEHRCFIKDLMQVRRGKSLRFDKDSIGCAGGVRYVGFPYEQHPDFNYFLSCGILGKVDGLRYKKTPELVEETLQSHPSFSAPEKNLVFKPWAHFTPDEIPAVLVFFCGADVISGLLTLASFDQGHACPITAPSCAGCASIVHYPLVEAQKNSPACVLGMFDISARPYINGSMLSFAIPWSKFTSMVDHMDESFLNTASWQRIQGRLSKQAVEGKA